MEDNNNIPVETFGAILARERKKRNLSLRDLQEVLGLDENNKPYVTSSYLSRIENSENSNPSFKVVCLLVSKLSLDLQEVFRVFGFKSIMPTEFNSNIENIEKLIRLTRIKIPSDNLYIDEDVYLTQSQKETIISLINNAFKYGICNSQETIDYLSEIIGCLELFRFELQDIFEYKFIISETTFNINIEKKVLLKMQKYNISQYYVCRKIESLGHKLLHMDDEFFIRDAKDNISIYCERNNDIISVKSVSKCYAEVN